MSRNSPVQRWHLSLVGLLTALFLVPSALAAPLPTRTIIIPSAAELKYGLPSYAHDFAEAFVKVAAKYDLQPEQLAALCSRESGFGSELSPHRPGGNPEGVGDIRKDGPHGFGLMQVDKGTWAKWLALKDPSGKFLWQVPQFNIDKGAEILVAALADLKSLGMGDQMRDAFDAYNTGDRNTLAGEENHKNPDLFSTGKNYGSDVAYVRLPSIHNKVLAAMPSVQNGDEKCCCTTCLYKGKGPLKVTDQAARANVPVPSRFVAADVGPASPSPPAASPSRTIITAAKAKPATPARAPASSPSRAILGSSAALAYQQKPHPAMEGVPHTEFTFVLQTDANGKLILDNGSPRSFTFGEATNWDESGNSDYLGPFYSGGEHAPERFMNLAYKDQAGGKGPATPGIWNIGEAFHWAHIAKDAAGQFAMALIRPGTGGLELPPSLKAKLGILKPKENGRAGILIHHGPTPLGHLDDAAKAQGLDASKLRAQDAEKVIGKAGLVATVKSCSWSTGCLILPDPVRVKIDNFFKNKKVSPGGRVIIVTYVNGRTGERIDINTLEPLAEPVASR